MVVEENMRLMQTLDDAWNKQDWETFKKRHAENVAVYWPGQPEPTRGRHSHHNEAVEFFKTFPDNRVENRPYKIFFGQGDYTLRGPVHRHHERTHESPQRDNNSGDQQKIRSRILHSGPLEERGDSRRKAVL